MPIYNYECLDGHKHDELVLAGESEPTRCKECGEKLARVMSRSSFQLKGGGWEKDGYSSAKGDA